jgi:hypothetical protein
MKTFNRGHLKRLVAAGRVVLHDAYNFDDQYGSSRTQGQAMPVRFMPDEIRDRKEGECYVWESDFVSRCGGAYEAGVDKAGVPLVRLRVHSNCFYTFKILDKAPEAPAITATPAVVGADYGQTTAGVHPTQNTDVPDNIKNWQDDVIGAAAIEDAVEALLGGQQARFALISRKTDSCGWTIKKVIRMGVERSTAETRARGYGDRLRVHEGDRDPLTHGEGSEALPIYDCASPVRVAAALTAYLLRVIPSFQGYWARLQA